MTEEITGPCFCEVCGIDVSSKTSLKRFEKLFCSEGHMEQYTKVRQRGLGEEYEENRGEKREKEKEKGWRGFLGEFARSCC